MKFRLLLRYHGQLSRREIAMGARIVLSKDVKVTKLLKEIPDGTYFTGKIGKYNEELFLKAEGKILGLSNPSPCGFVWSGPVTPVDDYKEVNVEIHVVN